MNLRNTLYDVSTLPTQMFIELCQWTKYIPTENERTLFQKNLGWLRQSQMRIKYRQSIKLRISIFGTKVNKINKCPKHSLS